MELYAAATNPPPEKMVELAGEVGVELVATLLEKARPVVEQYPGGPLRRAAIAGLISDRFAVLADRLERGA